MESPPFSFVVVSSITDLSDTALPIQHHLAILAISVWIVLKPSEVHGQRNVYPNQAYERFSYTPPSVRMRFPFFPVSI